MASTHVTVAKLEGVGDFQTIAAAVAASSSGVSVEDRSTITILDDGVYEESVTLSDLNHITFVAAGDCVIESASTVFIMNKRDYEWEFAAMNGAKPLARIKTVGSNFSFFSFAASRNNGLRVSGWDFKVLQGTDVRLSYSEGYGHTWSFKNCRILPPETGASYNTTALVFCGQYPVAGSPSTITIDGCDFSQISYSGALCIQGVEGNRYRLRDSKFRLGRLVALRGGSTLKFTIEECINNIFTITSSVTATFLTLDGVHVAGQKSSLQNNLFVGDNNPESVCIEDKGEAGRLICQNNIFLEFGTGVKATQDQTIQNNCFSSVTTPITGEVTQTGEVLLDPEIETDPIHWRIDIAESSPCIDAGLSIPEITTDIYGRERPEGDSYDIGPFERKGGFSVVLPVEMGQQVYFMADGTLTTAPDSGDRRIPTEEYTSIPSAVVSRVEPSSLDSDGYALALVTITGPTEENNEIND